MKTESVSKSTLMSTWRQDGRNIVLLLLLYTLQGVPLGLSAAIPMILQNRGASYKQQAEFSFVTWPFSFKLLWAPIVDSLYSRRLGRRKTWLVPIQYLIGVFMCTVSGRIEQMVGEQPNIELLTFVFFTLNFLAATQDIVVDGWALTILDRRHVGHASTCNSVGQTAGFFLSYVVFMALESTQFCNLYLRSVPQDGGIITLSGFLYFWGWVFLLVTTLVAIFKKETSCNQSDSEHSEKDIKAAYTSLKQILSLKPIQTLVLILLTCKIGFSATDSVMTLKLVESGVPIERLGLITIPLIPVQLLLPLVISKYTTGPKPLDIFLRAVPFRLLFSFVAAFLVAVTPIWVPHKDQGLPISYVLFLLVCYGLHQICVYCMFVAMMAFFAKISDSTVGGTYMTLLNTVLNLGNAWPAMLSLYFVDPLTWKQCIPIGDSASLMRTLSENFCGNSTEKEMCLNSGGKCETVLDGFYVETAICTVIGILWLLWATRKLHVLQSLQESTWRLTKSKRKI